MQKLFKKLGYHFKDTSLLTQALTHRSHKPEHNERLEFLGDSVLNFVIANELFVRYPGMTEGKLSRARANLVNGEVLATLSTTLGIDQYIRLGQGEIKSGGMKRKSTLSDCLEALIGAIYLDGGITVCQQVILSLYRDKFQIVESEGPQKDPKTTLQEYMQAQKMPLPQYHVINLSGKTHDQIFHVQCLVDGLEINAFGQGTSRRKAEQSAAQIFLTMIEKINET
ncbi:MAG: rnc [Gammaproteobacteria bacterium]|nr:rnc [Gammaproteobacteria bacterium]